MRMRGLASTLAFILIIVIAASAVWYWPPGRRNLVSARSALYALVRERGRADYSQSLTGWYEVTSDHFIVRYQRPDSDIADLVLTTAEQHYAEVTRDLGYVPPEKTLIAIYPTRDSLAQSLGWTSNQDAVGVYWGGAIRILSPHAWIETNSPAELAKLFTQDGPVVHEFTHLVLDYETAGNYPRWFTEGLAQWEEYRITGYVWNDPDGDLSERSGDALYSLADLDDHFDSLDNQALAYRESLSLITYLARGDNGAKLKEVITDLSQHYTLSMAVESVYGISYQQLEANWRAWVAENPYPWQS